MEASTEGFTRVGDTDQKLLHTATVEMKASPWRGDKLALTYLPAVPLVLEFGAKSYTFTRDDQDRELFTHSSTWENKADFEQYWFSHEMQAIRDSLVGLHDLPLFPHWHTVIEQSATQ